MNVLNQSQCYVRKSIWAAKRAKLSAREIMEETLRRLKTKKEQIVNS